MGTTTSVFITGATGFIGRYVLRNLLDHGCIVFALIRPESKAKRAQLIESLLKHADQSTGQLIFIEGNLAAEDLGLKPEAKTQAKNSDHAFHLAALYDLDASNDELEKANIQGTENLCKCLLSMNYKGQLHHVSSIAVAGDYNGMFTEAMFNEGQTHPHAYHRSKYESERIVRESSLDFTIYRPGSVVGHSKTGFIDRIDGIYYGFSTIKALSKLLPSWVKIPMPKISGGLNVVPVDFVADAITHIALAKRDDQDTFHIVDPSAPSITSLAGTLLKVAGGPALGRMPGKISA
ncbi:MAG: NAD-dependent epimerase/dehydratase family protein, partial [Deltaproteobacteria bacterium]|nr:NAD-dependent epimerase/dehydratase family protein [Deltaproteobacteria bacterium]